MLTLFAQITKLDEEKRLVFGYASTEALDRQGEIVRREALEAALPEYMRFANIREMHQPSAVGVAHEAEVDDKGLYLAAKVVDPTAWDKVKQRVYKGFSIGGRVTARDPNDKRIITGVDLTEISLVDRPANPEATIELFKRDGDGGLRPQPLCRWECGVPAHAHECEIEASLCMERQMMVKRDYTPSERKHMIGTGEAMTDGSFPIKDGQDLANAVRAYGLAKDKEKAKRHITARAQALGLAHTLPAHWDGSTKDQNDDDVAKIGARNSAADQTRIQAIHDHCVGLGACCPSASDDDDDEDDDDDDDRTMKAARMAELAKLMTERDRAVRAFDEVAVRMAPLLAELGDLKKRLAIVEATPLPAKGVIGPVAISKEEDRMVAAAIGLDTRLAVLPPGRARADEILRNAYFAERR